jgi:hypothetical protein
VTTSLSPDGGSRLSRRRRVVHDGRVNELTMVIDEAKKLEIRPREKRWAHLSLCVLDAVFSIGARYTTTVRTCRRYADQHRLAPLQDDGRHHEQPLGEFVRHVHELGPTEFAATVLGNRQRTSTGRSGVLKAEAALLYAEALVRADVERHADVAPLFADDVRMEALTADLRTVPGNGGADVRLGYLWMLLGADDLIKPDRIVLRWLAGVLGRGVREPEARDLIGAAAAQLACTPWELDHAVWNAPGTRVPSASTGRPPTR